MKSLKVSLSLLFCLTLTEATLSQTTPFDLTEYQQFLNQHQNMSASQLLEMYPAGEFKKGVNIDWETVSYLETIENNYN